MGLLQAFRLAFKSLASSKMRSFLTMLGIIIGVGSVIILVSLMQGMTGMMTSEFEGMGITRLSVNIMGRGSSRSVDTADMFALVEENSDVFLTMSPNVSFSGTVKQDTTTYSSTTVTGVSEGYPEGLKLPVENGRFISYTDTENRTKTAVIGQYIAENAFTGDALGQTIKINGNPFTVVGVLAKQDDVTEGSSDDCIFIPYTTAAKQGGKAINSYVFVTHTTDLNARANDLISNSLYTVFQSEDFYSIMDTSALLDSITEMTDMMTMVLVGIAGISLLVGGIGIMNIMLVSVTERTREIGIRKSLGAKRRDIMRQFVIEAATTSAVGGVIGIVFGVIVAVTVGKLIDLPVTPSLAAILLSFGISVGIGVFFGFMPAGKASKLNPIDALRYD